MIISRSPRVAIFPMLLRIVVAYTGQDLSLRHLDTMSDALTIVS